MRKNCFIERNLKFDAEGGEFAKILRSLEPLIQGIKVQDNFGNNGFLTFPACF